MHTALMGVLLSVQLLLLLLASGKLHLLHVLYLELVVIIQCVRIPAKRHNTNTHLNLSEAHRREKKRCCNTGERKRARARASARAGSEKNQKGRCTLK